MAIPTVYPEAERLQRDLLERNPEGTSLDRQTWDRLIVMGYRKSAAQADAITKTGEKAGFWLRHHDRVTGRGRVEVFPAAAPTPQPPLPMPH